MAINSAQSQSKHLSSWRRPGTVGICIMLFLALTLSKPLHAQLQTDTLKIKEVMVTAAPALLLPQYSLPGSVGKVNRELINSTWSRTGAEALENATGVWLQKTNHGGGAPIIRGLTGNQVLLTLDGVRLNNSIYRYGPNQYLSQINPSWIDHIDVKRGSGSVEYGSDALGGVVNIHSGSPLYTDESQLLINLGTTLGTHYRLKNYTEISASGDVILTSPDFYVKAGYTRSSFGNLISGSPEVTQVASGYLENAGNFKYAHKINENNAITIAWFRDIQKEVGRTDKMTGKYDEYFFDPQIMDLGYIRWSISDHDKYFEKIEATLSYNKVEENRRIREANSFMQNNESDLVNTLGAKVLIVLNIADNWKAASGVEYYQDRVNSSAYTLALLQASRTPYRGLYTDNARMKSASLFSNHVVDFGKLNLTFGARLNNTNIEGQDLEFGDFQVDPTALVGSAGLNYELIKGFAVMAQVSTGFRSPNINDISSFGLFDYGFEVPSPDLKPEKSLSSELGIKMFFQKLSGTFTAYQTNLSNLIVRQPGVFNGDSTYNGEPVYQKTNTDKALIRGIETDWNWLATKKILVSAYATYTFGKDLENENPLRRIPPLFGQLRVKYKISNRISAGSVLKAATKQSRLSEGDIDDDRIPDGGTPGWICWDAYAAYSTNSWIFSLHALNLTNSNYRIHGSGLQQPGTGLLLKLQSTL